MQVGIHNNANSTVRSASLARGNIAHTQNIKQSSRLKEGALPNFPEAALLSTRPIRYNISLNQQITAVQQSDHFLAQVESKLVQLNHSVIHHNKFRGNQANQLNQQLNDLSQLLNARRQLSGNTVDSQLSAVPNSNPRVNFSIKGAENWLQHPESETLIFVLAGEQREFAAVRFQDDSSPNEALRLLNLGLGRLGIHGRFQDKQLVFSVDEAKWPSISQGLNVRGEGHRFPEGQFFSINSQVQGSLKQTVDKLTQSGSLTEIKKYGAEFHQALEHVIGQRKQLTAHKENIQDRINSLATFAEKGKALQASELLKQQLMSGQNQYDVLYQATAGQANISRNTVRNLLGRG